MRKTHIFRFLLLPAISAASILAFLLLPGARAEITDPGPDSGKTPLMETFTARYEEVVHAVREGKLPENAGRQAEELRISLRKALIYNKARIDAFTLEVREYKGKKQEEALANLINAVAEREGIVADHIRKMEGLSDITPPPAPVETTGKTIPSSKEDRGKENRKSSDMNIEVDFGPEDIIETPQSLE